MTRGIRVVARAKLTLSLRVLGRRPDGYHDLEALVASLEDPHDVVSLRLRSGPGVTLRLSGRALAGVPDDETNLAVRAARLLLEEAEDEVPPGPWTGSGFDLSVHKSIPAGAGLGGGSADAAGTLRGGARLLGLRLDDAALAALGARLGSDVPFCVQGGVAWMRGRGEVIEPAAPLGPFPVMVAVPAFGIATPEVYAAWDRLGGPKYGRPGAGPAGDLVNDLEPAAEAVEPRLRPFREALEALSGSPVLLAGSGSAYAVATSSMAEADMLAGRAAAELGATTFATQVATGGVEFQPF